MHISLSNMYNSVSIHVGKPDKQIKKQNFQFLKEGQLKLYKNSKCYQKSHECKTSSKHFQSIVAYQF